MTQQQSPPDLALVPCGSGRTGRRVAERPSALGRPVRIGSRSATPAFDGNDELGWDACLEGGTAACITDAPDLAMSGATDAIRGFVGLARRRGVEGLVLRSGRGEEEAQACERIVRDSGLAWTIVRASCFDQNFSAGAFVDRVLNGAIKLPAGDQVEPFVDVDDIAADLSRATGREIRSVNVRHEAFVAELSASGTPREIVLILDDRFATVLDGRNARLTDGVRRSLGRLPRDFAERAREAAAAGAWSRAA